MYYNSTHLSYHKSYLISVGNFVVKLRTSLGKGQLAFSRPLKTFSVRQLLGVLPFPICKMSSLSSLAGARLERKAEIGDKLFSFGVDLDLLSFLKWFAGLV